MSHCIRPIAFKPPRLIGLSERLIVSHYENNYGGTVRRLNAIEEVLSALDFAEATDFTINALTREHLLASNSMVLHEIYFDSLGGEDGLGGLAVEPEGALGRAIERDFGSFHAWWTQFCAMARALAGDSAWVLLVWSVRHRRLENQWAGNHTAVCADAIPLLALDMYEHAYQMDFGADAAAYVDAFARNIHWGRAAARFGSAKRLSHTTPTKEPLCEPLAPEDLRDMLRHGEPPALLDVCLLDDLPRRHDKLPGATCVKSDQVSHCAAQLPRDTPVIVYCMYGFQVSADAARELRELGVDARVLAGGISAWRAIGAATEPYSA